MNDKQQGKFMINFYLALTVLIAWLISSGTYWTLTSLVTDYSGLNIDFKPAGFIVLNSLVVFSIAFAISHRFIKAIKLSDYLTEKNSFSVAILVASLCGTLPTILSASVLAYRDFDLTLFSTLRLIANFGVISIILLIIMQISYFKTVSTTNTLETL